MTHRERLEWLLIVLKQSTKERMEEMMFIHQVRPNAHYRETIRETAFVETDDWTFPAQLKWKNGLTDNMVDYRINIAYKAGWIDKRYDPFLQIRKASG
jgi:hypothetical protein